MKVVAILGGLASQMTKYAYFLHVRRNCHNEECLIDTSFFNLNFSSYPYALKEIFGIDIKDLADEMGNKYYRGKEIEAYFDVALTFLKKTRKFSKYWFVDRGVVTDYFGNEKVNITRKCKGLIKIFIPKKLVLMHRKKIDQLTRENALQLNMSDPSIYQDTYPDDILKLEGVVYFDEFSHMSDKYFSDVKDEVKAAFTFPDFTEEKNINCAKCLANTESVAIHVRRTDHMYDNIALFERRYFAKSVQFLKERCQAPIFVIFSEDLQWCINNLSELGLDEYDEIIYADWNNQKQDFSEKNLNWECALNDYKDMQLMTYCKHNILSISGFGWMGSYLSSRTNKIVCAPEGFWHDASYHF